MSAQVRLSCVTCDLANCQSFKVMEAHVYRVLSDKRAQASVFDERNDFDVTNLFAFL